MNNIIFSYQYAEPWETKQKTDHRNSQWDFETEGSKCPSRWDSRVKWQEIRLQKSRGIRMPTRFVKMVSTSRSIFPLSSYDFQFRIKFPLFLRRASRILEQRLELLHSGDYPLRAGRFWLLHGNGEERMWFGVLSMRPGSRQRNSRLHRSGISLRPWRCLHHEIRRGSANDSSNRSVSQCWHCVVSWESTNFKFTSNNSNNNKKVPFLIVTLTLL